jgi:hypothetical protein
MADYNSAYTGAQIDAGIASAQTAVQPGDLATVATSGAYSDLSGTPSLATVATSGDYDDLLNTPDLSDYVVSDPTGVSGADAITNIMSLTQAEFDAIGSPNASTLYVITG